MNAWPFIVGAYAVTVLAVVIEILAVRARHRAARAAAQSSGMRTGEAIS